MKTSSKILDDARDYTNHCSSSVRPVVKGKFIYLNDDKFYVRGVTYGPFNPDSYGCEYKSPKIVDADFSEIKKHNINTVRTYTVPPRWFLDLAFEHGLRVMVGLLGTHHTTFIDQPKLVSKLRSGVLEGLQNCYGHPAVLCYSIGNEIPASIVRWYGRKKVENYLESLYQLVKDKDPGSLVTYVNYPTTEYLQLPFLDILCFNVYLESEISFTKYLSRLQTISGDKPLILAELGLDSKRNGLQKQAESLYWQVNDTFKSGCAGAIVFSWTDEWYRGGQDIDDWDFGLTTRDRTPKPALEWVKKSFSVVPNNLNRSWPGVSVVICTYNGSKTLRECFDYIIRLDYPNYEVIVVNDGSTDSTFEIIREYEDRYGFKTITTENLGLSSARNTGLAMANNEIVAYIDDDAYPDAQWLKYIASCFLETDYVGVGGPNVTPDSDGFIAKCVSKSPGNPVQVLITDTDAEHIPGCNMAFRKSIVNQTGGFDTQYRIAGDDVDLCWRLLEKGYKIGYSPSAMVWHHRRNSIRKYLKQQFNYGRAESLLEKNWPEKFSAFGHINWNGRIYGAGYTGRMKSFRSRIYHGTWGTAPFQPLYQKDYGKLSSYLLTPEWFLVIACLMLLSVLGLLWEPLILTWPLLGMALSISFIISIRNAIHANRELSIRSIAQRVKFIFITASLHLLQPMARLYGRINEGLTPWRKRNFGFSSPFPSVKTYWSEEWSSTEDRLRFIENSIKNKGAVVSRGGTYDAWDLEIRGGLFGSTRILMVSEEHELGKQLTRIKSWPLVSLNICLLILIFLGLAVSASLDKSWISSILLLSAATFFFFHIILDCGISTHTGCEALKDYEQKYK